MRLAFIIRRLPIGWIGRFVLLHLLARWHSLVTIMVGVALVAMIGASAPLYTAAIAQIGMEQRLEQQPPKAASIFVQINLRAAEAPDFGAEWARHDADFRRQVRQTFDAALPGWVIQTITLGETTPMQAVYQNGDLDARLRVVYYEGWEQTTYLLDGTWPSESSDPAIDLEVAIGQRTAETLALRPGDELTLDQRGWDTSTPVRARITGIVGETESAFAQAQDLLRINSARQGGIESNLLTTRDSFLRVAVEHIPDTGTTFGWWLFFDHAALPYARLPQAAAIEEEFRQRLLTLYANRTPSANLIYQAQLVPILEQYESEVALLRAPFGLLLLQIGALALFFLVVTAALVRRSFRREVAMLQTRGASNGYLLLLDGLEALIICGLATITAPFLVRYVLEWIVPLLTRIDRLDLALSRRAFVYAGAAAGISWIVLVASLWPMLRLPLTMAGGSMARSENRMWWQRYYQDVVLLVIGVAALWRLITSESPLTTTRLGEVQADPLLLLAPALLFVAVGSALLRLFPSFSRLIARLVSRQTQLVGSLAAWRVSREPVHYGRITFLLTLAIGIGWLATSFRATLVRSQHDQAAYAVGADLRLEERDGALKIRRVHPLDFYLGLPGVEAASLVARFFVAQSAQGDGRSWSGDILAVDPSTFETVSYWRSDLGVMKLPPAPDPLVTPGRALPFAPARIGLWARADQPLLDNGFRPVLSDSGDMIFEPNERQLRMVGLWARLRVGNGASIHVPLSPMTAPGTEADWVYLEGALPEVAPGELRLESIYWRNGWQWDITRGHTFRFYFADLTLIDSGGAPAVLDWLTADDRWDLLPDSGAAIDGATDVALAPDRPGILSRQATWVQDGTRSMMGLALNYPEAEPIPAVASERFAAMNGLLPGALFQVGLIEGVHPWFKLVDTAAYFPTLDPNRRLFVVVDQRALLYALNRRPGAMAYATEAWLRLDRDTSAAALMNVLRKESPQTVITKAQTYARALDDLEASALMSGLIGLLYLAFGVALVLTAISLLTYTGLTALQRRTEFGALRALGLSADRLVTSMALEQVIVIVIGVLLGAALGAVMSAQVLPTLAFGATGEPVTPPFVIRVEVAALIQYGLLLVAALGVTFGASLVLVRRLSLSNLLRFGEE